MTLAFWACAALLLAGALLLVLPPLRRGASVQREAESPLAAYRDQRAQADADLMAGALTPMQHAQALAELQARVVDEVGELRAQAGPDDPSPRLSMVIVAALICSGAVAAYGLLGTPAALRGSAPQQAAGEASPHAMDRAQIEAMVEGLAEKLRKNPDDPAGWQMLARSYVAFNRLPEAADAYDRATRLAPRDPQILSDYADVLAMVNGRSLEGRPLALVEQALKLDPKHQKSLSLAGTAAFDRGDFAQAASWWKQLLATVPPGSQQAQAVQANIAQAQAGGAATAPVAQAVAASSADAGIEGTVTLADAIKGKVPAGATLFVYARAAEGGRMPLAILRVPVGSFPYRFRLDDSQAMAPQMRLSTQSQVLLVARISRTGNAMPQPGDLTGTLGPVKVGARDLHVVIGEVVP